jgi:predicted transcriptional regulator
MDISLSADLRHQVQRKLASGRHRSSEGLIERAVRYFLDEGREPT